jgi:hypothetical protein
MIEPLSWDWPLGGKYIAVVFAAEVAIAILSGMLRASEHVSEKYSHPESDGYPTWSEWWSMSFIVWRGYRTPHMDRLIPASLGIVELFIYPTAMRYGAWDYIGAWIALKSVAQWSRWTDKRAVFNRYLLGNAMVLIASYLISLCVLGGAAPN